MDPGGAHLGPFERLDRFAALVGRGTPDAVPLDAAALAMAAVLRARPTDHALAALDDLAAGCDDASFEGVRAHLFDRLGFQGDSSDYDHPRNSFLDVVLERRRGLPILLATVTIEVARRVGVGVVGVGMPMHFLVRAADDADAFVDPFTGRALDRAGVRRRFDELTGGRLAWDEAHLTPTPARLVVLRMLTNLRASYARRRDAIGLALVAKMRAAIPEVGPDAALEAARLGGALN
jgi:regulator of sirC expression with transglutaminase-like and TPR domain